MNKTICCYLLFVWDVPLYGEYADSFKYVGSRLVKRRSLSSAVKVPQQYSGNSWRWISRNASWQLLMNKKNARAHTHTHTQEWVGKSEIFSSHKNITAMHEYIILNHEPLWCSAWMNQSMVLSIFQKSIHVFQRVVVIMMKCTHYCPLCNVGQSHLVLFVQGQC